MEKKIYRFEIMTAKNYAAFLAGEPHYSEFYDVEAESPELALVITEYENPTYIIPEGIEPEVVEEKRYNFSEKDKLLSRIIWLEDELKNARRLYEIFED